jgi:hypothetical protein
MPANLGPFWMHYEFHVTPKNSCTVEHPRTMAVIRGEDRGCKPLHAGDEQSFTAGVPFDPTFVPNTAVNWALGTVMW